MRLRASARWEDLCDEVEGALAHDSLYEKVMSSGYVLVVEDDPDVRGIVIDYLRLTFGDVREACNGADALALLESVGWPSVVLTDIVMPGVLGTTVAEYVSIVSAERIPLAFVTGSPERAPSGAIVFRKPAKLAALRAFVAAHHQMT